LQASRAFAAPRRYRSARTDVGSGKVPGPVQVPSMLCPGL